MAPIISQVELRLDYFILICKVYIIEKNINMIKVRDLSINEKPDTFIIAQLQQNFCYDVAADTLGI